MVISSMSAYNSITGGLIAVWCAWGPCWWIRLNRRSCHRSSHGSQASGIGIGMGMEIVDECVGVERERGGALKVVEREIYRHFVWETLHFCILICVGPHKISNQFCCIPARFQLNQLMIVNHDWPPPLLLCLILLITRTFTHRHAANEACGCNRCTL